MKGSSIELKKINRNNIYQLVYTEERISKAEIAKRLDISFPTVTQNLRELMEEGLVMEKGSFESTGGRKAKGICVDSDARKALGIDITKNHISAVLVNLKGDITHYRRMRVPFEDTDEYYEKLGGLARELLLESGIEKEKILGAGISVPAIVSANRKDIDFVVLADIPRDFHAKITAHIPFPCAICNDSNAGGFAEQWRSRQKGSMIYLSLSNTVGGAVVSGHRIVSGDNQRCGEFGHMLLVPGGRPCYCGKKGCVDAYCAAHLLSDETGGNLAAFFEHLDAGEKAFAVVWEEYLEHLSVAIHNIRMCFDYEIVLGGYLGQYIEPRMGHLRRLLQEKNMFEEKADYVRACHYTMEAAAVGSALYYIEPFIKSI
ncbi:MAG: ROK family transcriptional regulator [Lachnospiraceae bacterium]|nr:ROK family transcriptional regulator [Lachnospiraceae bacterium]